MVEISAKMVKELRDKTGAGMMDCKKALKEAGGDMEEALDFLRKAGIAKAGKKAGRSTNEGAITVKIDGNTAAIVEVLCETDFVAKNEEFKAIISDSLDKILSYDVDGCASDAIKADMDATVTAFIARLGENTKICRAARWSTEGQFAHYLHAGGKVGVMVDVEGEISAADLKTLCMHIAAFSPSYLCPDCVSAAELAREKDIATEQVKGKPENIIGKIVDGKIQKWYTEVCLLKQPWITDDKSNFEKLFPKVKINRFIRWAIGETDK